MTDMIDTTNRALAPRARPAGAKDQYAFARSAVQDTNPRFATPREAFEADVFLADADLPDSAFAANVAEAYNVIKGSGADKLAQVLRTLADGSPCAVLVSVDELIALDPLWRLLEVRSAALLHPDSGGDWLAVAPRSRIDLDRYLLEGQRAQGAADAARAATGADLAQRRVNVEQPTDAPAAPSRVIRDDDLVLVRPGEDGGDDDE